jgi:AcrR family transcriptional regulator
VPAGTPGFSRGNLIALKSGAVHAPPRSPLSRPMAERRGRILAAARSIVAARGYEALTMRELAQKSRVTVPTLYNLIGGKEAVLAAAVEEQTARFLAGIERREGASPAARVLAVIESCTRELLGLPAYYRTLLHLLYTAEAAGPVRARVDRALGGELARALRAIREAGELAAWADERALLRSLRSQLGACALSWASGALSDAALPAEAAYQASLTLLGVTTGRSRAELERAARDAQAPRAPRKRRASG